MTIEEAKAILKLAKICCEYPHGAYSIALDIAIKALEKESILDKVKQAREEIENLTPWEDGLVEMYEVLAILDKLIESESKE